MNVKDLKIEFRYLAGNIACMSVDSVNGKPVHNDIDNEEAIILFNSLVGEKEGCRTLKTLLKENKILKENAEHNDKVVDKVNWENQQLKDRINKAVECIEKVLNSYKENPENALGLNIIGLLEILKEDNKEKADENN